MNNELLIEALRLAGDDSPLRERAPVGGGSISQALRLRTERGEYLLKTGGRPALIDPAVSYGDREADLAFTTLFGGFPESFYRAYAAAWPLPAGWRERRDLYNLYHLLNHLNLFGEGYGAQVDATLRRYVG